MTRPDETTNRLASDGPALARILGYAGAIPFLGCGFAGMSGADLAGFDPARLLISYAAVILSFLGGLHWGRVASAAVPERSAGLWLIWSVIPSLIGWAALLLPVYLAAIMLAACFLAALMIDLKLIAQQRWAAWMHSLRLRLTVVATASLFSIYIWG